VNDLPFVTAEGNGEWVFCKGEGATGIGVISARSVNGQDWLVAYLGLGVTLHAGDSIDAAVFDSRRASVTVDGTVTERHIHAWTRDGGQTWHAITWPVG
jgi:hypothetical protein